MTDDQLKEMWRDEAAAVIALAAEEADKASIVELFQEEETMSDKLKLVDWITEVAGEYIEPWVAGVIAESWQEDKNRIRELEAEAENTDLRQVAHRHDEELKMSEWQPIETAPRNGALVVAECFEDYPQVVYWHSEVDYGADELCQIWKSLITGNFVTPTRWKPLLETPR